MKLYQLTSQNKSKKEESNNPDEELLFSEELLKEDFELVKELGDLPI